jgi:hypothetical protein
LTFIAAFPCYVAFTNVCADTGSIGVPVGTHVDTPDRIATGCPFDVTCTAPTTHMPVTQGPLPAGGANAHPATAHGPAIVTIGIPDTNTVGLGTVGVATPPCAQETTAPT